MPEISVSTLNPLILKIYEAALEPALWQQITLEISNLMNSGATQLLVLNNTNQTKVLAASSRLCQQGQKEYVENYAAIDLRVPSLLKCAIGKPVQEYMFLCEEDQKNNREVTNFLQRHELENLTGSNLSIGNNWVWFGTARKGEGNIYTKDELSVFQALIPHIRKSLRLHLSLQSINSQVGSLADIWTYTGNSVVLFNGEGLVCFKNICAENLLIKKVFNIAQNRMYFFDQSANKRFQAALRRLLSSHLDLSYIIQDTFLVTDADGADYGIRLVPHLVAPDEMANAHSVRAFMLITPLRDATQYTPDEISRFGDIFNLTGAEKRAVKAVADLRDLTLFALEIGLKPDSVRKQLKSAMAKTGVRSQKELIRRLDRFCFIQMR